MVSDIAKLSKNGCMVKQGIRACSYGSHTSLRISRKSAKYENNFLCVITHYFSI